MLEYVNKPGLKDFGHLNEIFVAEDGCVEGKNHPSLDVIRTTLRRCQEIILAKGYLPKQILNLDETAINFGVGPTHIFASSTASRGSQEVSDWKGRTYHRCSNGGCRGWFPPDDVYFASFKIIGQMLRSD